MADNNKAVGPLAAAKLVALIKAVTAKKYDKTGGKIEGSAEITGGLKVGMSSEFSSSIKAGSEISSDMLLMAPIVALHDSPTEEVISFGVSGENAAKVTSPVSGGGTQYARLAVGTPTEDDDAATKAYVDEGLAAKASTATATQSTNGLMSAADKTKLNELFVPFKYFTYDATAASADMTPAEVKAFITANPHTPIYMLITESDTGTRPIWAVQQSQANDTVVFVSTIITRTTGVQEYKLVKAASDTAWGTISTGRLVTDDTPSVVNPTFTEDIDGHTNRVLGVGQDSAASNENLPYLTTGDYNKYTIDGIVWSDLRLYNGVIAYRDVSIDSIYDKAADGTMLPDIDFVLSNVVLTGTAAGQITDYTPGYYEEIKKELSRNHGNIWLSYNGETIRLASWKQSGSAAYVLTFFGPGSGTQPVKYVVTASASAATLEITGS